MRTINQILRIKIIIRVVIFLISLVSLNYLSPKFAKVSSQTLPGQFYFTQTSGDERIDDRASAVITGLCYGGRINVQEVVAWSYSYRTCGIGGSPVKNTSYVDVEAGSYYIYQHNSATVTLYNQILSVNSALTDCNANTVDSLNVFNPAACAMSLPDGIAGGRNGAPDYGQYPSGCASGFVLSGGICTRSTAFINSCNRFGGYDFDGCGCLGDCAINGSCSPIVIDVNGNGFTLTDALNGVNFDVDGNGSTERRAWTANNSDDAWLVLDRNKNGVIDGGREMFGNVISQPPPPSGKEMNGFRALTDFDEAGFGGNGDGQIDNQDMIFSSLRLWQDTNHNGISEASELKTLPALGLAKIDLNI